MAEKKETKSSDEKKEEREYIIPLRKSWAKVPRYKRANKAVKSIKEFLARHMKVRDRDLNKIKLDTYINELIWERGIRKPPVKIKVKAFREGEIIRAELSELPEKFRFKKEKLEKREKKAAETAKEKVKKPEEKEKEEETEEAKEEKKKEEEEKEKAVEESMKNLGKEAARKSKHMAKIKTKKSKHQRRMALQK
jgi:large subunit ribosomal protein L31e